MVPDTESHLPGFPVRDGFYVPSIDHETVIPTMADLLEAAVHDARGLDRTLYRPQSEEWHSPWPGSYCQVCLAGSFIAGTLRFPQDANITPEMIFGTLCDKLQSLDCMRNGEWSYAYYKFYSYYPSGSILRRLNRLPRPDQDEFSSWDEFDLHLASLEAIIPELREIEKLD